MRGGVEVGRIADAVALVVKRPRVASEIADLVGVKPETVRAWLTAFEDEGLVRRAAEKRVIRSSAATVWEWAATGKTS